MIIRASEARKKTWNNMNHYTEKELSEIMNQIEDAVANGKFSLSNNGSLQSETRKKLEQLGYEVKTGSQYNESYYSVSW